MLLLSHRAALRVPRSIRGGGGGAQERSARGATPSLREYAPLLEEEFHHGSCRWGWWQCTRGDPRRRILQPRTFAAGGALSLKSTWRSWQEKNLPPRPPLAQSLKLRFVQDPYIIFEDRSL